MAFLSFCVHSTRKPHALQFEDLKPLTWKPLAFITIVCMQQHTNDSRGRRDHRQLKPHPGRLPTTRCTPFAVGVSADTPLRLIVSPSEIPTPHNPPMNNLVHSPMKRRCGSHVSPPVVFHSSEGLVADGLSDACRIPGQQGMVCCPLMHSALISIFPIDM